MNVEQHISLEAMKLLVTGELPGNEVEAASSHLDHCPICQTGLEQAAGESTWWQETARQLKRDENDLPPAGSPDWSPIDFSVDFLEPAGDTELLGRLGEYEVHGVLGRGGMGVVLKARDPHLNRFVAIKALGPEWAASEVARKRFAREAKAAAAVVHPNVIAIHQVQSVGRLPFLVMPLIPGESLQQRLTTRGPLELVEILRIAMQTAAGLAAAHDQGLVHRDVKPANILLEPGIERVVLTDFGLARAADDYTLSQSGVIAGTPAYMSPEQSRGEQLDGRSDLFSLGCVIYEMATGRPPFRADGTLALLRRICEDEAQTPSSLRSDLPPWFDRIVMRLIAKQAAQRFATASEVATLSGKCLAHLQDSSIPLPAEFVERPKWRPWAWMAGCVVLLLIGLSTAMMLKDAQPTTQQIVPVGEKVEPFDPAWDAVDRELFELHQRFDEFGGRVVNP